MDYEKKYNDLIQGFKELLLNPYEEDVDAIKEVNSMKDSDVIYEIYDWVDRGMFPKDNGAIIYSTLSKYMSN